MTVNDIDALLPQTQCGLCDYAGCRPYAKAILKQGERIDKCPPGGVSTLRALGELLQQDPEPFVAQMQQKQKPTLLAVVREEECIGCTKCIQACPVDAIIGAAKVMHTVISDACTGCELCIPPCPVDCIDLVNIDERNEQQKQHMAEQSRQRYQKHTQRLKKHQHAKLNQDKIGTISARQAAIAQAVARTKMKKGRV